MNSNQVAPPISEGEEHDVKIEAVGEKGDGIARIKGFVVFVPNVSAGDEVKIKVTKVLAKVGFGDVLEKIEKKAPEPQGPTDDELFDESKDSEDFGEE